MDGVGGLAASKGPPEWVLLNNGIHDLMVEATPMRLAKALAREYLSHLGEPATEPHPRR